jgi:hypothetical protein
LRRRATSREQRKVPSRTICTTARQPFGEQSSAATGKLPAALLTSTAIGPRASSTRSNARAICSASRTSQAASTARPPASATAATPRARASSFRPRIATAAPARANSIAIAFPSPVPPPVIATTCPAYVSEGSIGRRASGGSGRAIG